MRQKLRMVFGFVWAMAWCCLLAAQQPGTPENVIKRIGTVKTVSGNTVTLKADSGSDVTVVLQESTRLAQLPAGETDLKAAVPTQAQNIQVGDRMLVRGTPAQDGQSVTATVAVVMKQGDLVQKQQHDREDWQKRGVGGIVTGIDPSSGIITISITPAYNVAVQTSPKTVFLRYAVNSVKFSDAKRGTFDQIKTGDQLRVRGDRSAEGKQIAAEEIVSGTFRNIAGTVISVDAPNGVLNVMDLITKKPVMVKVTPDSQLRKLTPQMAQGLAMLLKGRPEGAAPPSGPASPGAPAGRNGGPPDLQRMLGRVPSVAIADLQKGDALMVVSTQNDGSSPAGIITLLAGVEPVLTAASSAGSAASLLSGWNMSAGQGDAGPQ